MGKVAEQLAASTAERFDILRTLGAGGLGVVYEAYDRESDARVALKTLKRPSPEAITRLKREFRALEDLQHPNLVTLNELFEEQGEWFFTMELVDGKELLDYVRPTYSAHNENSATFDDTRLRQSLAQLASGLMALHGIGKVHRDVKPSNVLVTAEGRVVLLDFGLVADLDRDPDWTAANAVGTALYMAPEQAAGRPVGPEADWYALGAILYEALTGCPPFVGTTWQVLVEKQQKEPKPPAQLMRGVPDDLNALCLELLRIEPLRRPSGTQILQRLAQRASNTATSVRHCSWAARPSFCCSSRRWSIPSAASRSRCTCAASRASARAR
jgi:serine/threonine protein kinase